MRTPATELGLASRELGAHVRSALLHAGPEQVQVMLRGIADDARSGSLVYLHRGRRQDVTVLGAPLTLLREQLLYLHSVALALHEASRRLLDLWLADPCVRAALPVPHADQEWLRSCWRPGHAASNPIFGRLDASALLESPEWKASLQFLEPNLTGVGGLHMLPVSEAIAARRIAPLVQRLDPRVRLEIGQDARDLLVGVMLEHLQAIGRRGRRICFLEARWADSGPEEQALLAEHLHRRFGLTVHHADPSELVVDGDEVLFHGEPVDLAYRDYGLDEVHDLARRGVDVTPMRMLFAQNRMVSSIAAELEQKSIWEVFTDPALVDRHFTPAEREVFQRHVPWTRLVRQRRTLLGDGSEGELLEYLRRDRERLVLKPNRGYGGSGVRLGPELSQAEWDEGLARALDEPDAWVAQRLVPLAAHDFPVLEGDGSVQLARLHLVLGMSPTAEGLSLTARASTDRVVNVARHGGIAVVMLGRLLPLDSPEVAGRDSPAQ